MVPWPGNRHTVDARQIILLLAIERSFRDSGFDRYHLRTLRRLFAKVSRIFHIHIYIIQVVCLKGFQSLGSIK